MPSGHEKSKDDGGLAPELAVLIMAVCVIGLVAAAYMFL